MSDLKKKIIISLKPAAIFVLLNLPAVYQLTNKFFGKTWDEVAACPTPLGVVIHSAVFFLISYALMRNPRTSRETKVKHSLTSALLFAILSSGHAYKVVSKVLPSVTTSSGCPTIVGIAVQTVLFIAGLVGIMSVKK